MYRAYEISRCTDPARAPQTIHWAVIEGDPSAVAEELLDVVRAVVHPRAVTDAVGEVTALLERVETCTAVDPDDVKNLVRNPDLWELRLDVMAFGLNLRIYETEIPPLPQHIVALRVHQKIIDGTADEIREAQNVEIDLASRRWDGGRADFWGLP